MRLNRRRRRSLHDLDVGHASYEDFRANVEEGLDDERNDWVNLLLNDRERDERLRRRQAAQLARARPFHTAPLEAMQDEQLNVRHIVQPAYRDTLQVSRRISDRALYSRAISATEVLQEYQTVMRDSLNRHISRVYPGSVTEWEYAFDISRSRTNQETNITLTARRPHARNR